MPRDTPAPPWVWLSALTLLVSCASPSNSVPATTEPARLLQQLVQRHRICGAAVAVIRQRQLHSIATASGCDPALTVQPDSAYQAASLSKPVFAYAVLKLVGHDRLALDAPVLEYLPQGYRHAFNPLKPGLASQTDGVTDSRLRAVETVTGRPLDEVMRDLVFTPLDMAHSSYRWTPKVAERLLPGTRATVRRV